MDDASVDIEVAVYRNDVKVIAVIASYICPLAGEVHTFRGDDEKEAVKIARLDMVKRYGIDALRDNGQKEGVDE